MNAPRATPDAAPIIRAIVHACDTETVYVRSGHGSALLLVAADLDRHDVSEMMTALSREFLVLAAAPALRDAAVATILCGDSIDA
jgi:hypothetical protein